MKKLWILLAAVALAALLAACSLLPTTTSIDTCVSNFMSALNSSDRSSLYTNLDSSASQYNAVKAASYWNTKFPTGESYSLTGQTTAGTTVTATIKSTVTYAGNTIIFVMTTDSSGNYVIHSITLNGSLIFN